MALLQGFRDEELHPQIVEAIKRAAVARATYTHAIGAIDAQYLKPLVHLDRASAAQAAAMRGTFRLPPD